MLSQGLRKRKTRLINLYLSAVRTAEGDKFRQTINNELSVATLTAFLSRTLFLHIQSRTRNLESLFIDFHGGWFDLYKENSVYSFSVYDATAIRDT